jgi:hypothetical protein
MPFDFGCQAQREGSWLRQQVRFGRSATGCFQVELWSRAKVQERRDFGSPAESRGVAGKTPSHGVASKCWGGVLNA